MLPYYIGPHNDTEIRGSVTSNILTPTKESDGEKIEREPSNKEQDIKLMDYDEMAVAGETGYHQSMDGTTDMQHVHIEGVDTQILE